MCAYYIIVLGYSSMFWGFIFEKEDGDMLEKRIRLSATLCSKRQQNHLATLSVCVGDNARVAFIFCC